MDNELKVSHESKRLLDPEREYLRQNLNKIINELNRLHLVDYHYVKRAIAEVFNRLNHIWPNDLEKDFDLQDKVDLAAMTGTREEFEKVLKEWEDTEIKRVHSHAQKNQ